MSGGSSTDAGRAICPGSISNRRKSGAMRTCRSNSRIISAVSAMYGRSFELALDLDDRSLARERREQQQAGDPLRERSGNDDRPAARLSRLDRDRRAAVGRLEAQAQVRERVEKRPDRAATEIFLSGQRDRRVRERREADHEVERGTRAPDRDDLALHVVRAARHDQASDRPPRSSCRARAARPSCIARDARRTGRESCSFLEQAMQE